MIDIDPNRPDVQQAGERPLNLSDFAQRNQITEDRVWELIEEGELAARFVNDEILILREHEAMADEPAVIEMAAVSVLEPEVEVTREVKEEAEPAEREPDAELPPTDDYRDLLMFAQDAMNRTMDLSRQLLATKDELIRMKSEKVTQLETQVQRQDLELKRLKRKVEDLETLCRLTPPL